MSIKGPSMKADGRPRYGAAPQFSRFIINNNSPPALIAVSSSQRCCSTFIHCQFRRRNAFTHLIITLSVACGALQSCSVAGQHGQRLGRARSRRAGLSVERHAAAHRRSVVARHHLLGLLEPPQGGRYPSRPAIWCRGPSPTAAFNTH